ncbi:LpqB family beta-propeller domain-containing protein [Aquipuribacter sp. MA13-6]|uniref:LpqB family beta-propeller domain-containing protein n=1 Tax=unclassified Aquipuribacter TaxID=2635084 RepID=UPI003EED8A77
MTAEHRDDRRRRRGLPVVLAGLVAALLTLSGCVSIPSSGRVEAGGDVDQQGARSALRVTAAGPAAGADERQLVEGFLAAVAGLDDFTVAREFLAPGAGSWRPTERTVVYENLLTFGPVVGDGDAVSISVRASVVGRIDESGRYTEQRPAVEELPFDLVRVGGEWRIAALPPGVLVSEVDRDRVLTAFGVYFTDPTETYLVPDVRWFPQLSSSATSLTRALLAGPSAPYLGALESAAPAGTRLDLSSVQVENGVATVDLTDEVLLADVRSRAVLLAQLRQTLRAVPGVSSVRMTVDGVQVEDPDGGDTLGSPTLVVDPGVDSRPLVLAPATEPDADPADVDPADADAAGAGSEPEAAAPVDATAGATAPAGDVVAEGGGEVAPPDVAPGVAVELDASGRPLAPAGSSVLRLDLDGASPLAGTEGVAEQVRTGLAVAQDGDSVAGLDATRGSLWVQQPGAAAVELVTGRDLTTPSFDPPGQSWVWTVSQGDPAGDEVPQVLAAAAAVVPVEARWLGAGDEVRALRVSRDGTRVLVVLARADGAVQVQVRGVRRDATTGRPLSLSQAAFDVAPELADAVDASWVSDDEVVVLGRTGEEPLRPVVVQVGGLTEPLAPTPGAVSVTAALGERTVVVGTADGTVLRRSGSLWLDGPFGVSPAHGG